MVAAVGGILLWNSEGDVDGGRGRGGWRLEAILDENGGAG